MSKLFSKGELHLIRLITESGLLDYDTISRHLVNSPLTTRNRIIMLGEKISLFPNNPPIPTGINWQGITSLLFLALEWQRGEYVGDSTCPGCIAQHDFNVVRVGQNGLCFGHSLESRVLASYAQIEAAGKGVQKIV